MAVIKRIIYHGSHRITPHKKKRREHCGFTFGLNTTISLSSHTVDLTQSQPHTKNAPKRGCFGFTFTPIHH
ncbi:hypothetical protein LXL04_027962 [Taraxacum kok-saghyz]